MDRWRRRKQYESLVAGGYDPFGPSAKLVKKGRPLSDAADFVEMNAQVAALREQITGAIREHQLPAAVAIFLQLSALDPTQVLPPEEQLDVGNQLMTDARYSEAAAAYEDFLRLYPNSHQCDQITLVLGVIYGRYLAKPERAVELFQNVLPRLHDEKQRRWAEEELKAISPVSSPVTTPRPDRLL